MRGRSGTFINVLTLLVYILSVGDVLGPLDTRASRLLSDRSYEKRSMAAHEVESRVKQALQQRDYYGQEQHTPTTTTVNIASIITVLTSTSFTKSPYPNARKGGLLGLASVAIALENRNLDPFLDSLIAPVLYLFDDDDNRCRYYACEAMFNISKVARGVLLKGRRMCLALDGVCRLVADVDQEVKSGAQYLDRLLKDIVSDVSNRPFILREIPTGDDKDEEELLPSPVTTGPGMYPEDSATSTSCDVLLPAVVAGVDNNCINVISTPQSPALPEDPQGQRLMHLPALTRQEDGLFDLGAFIGRIAAHLRVVNPFIKQLAMSWISVLHSLPTTRNLLLLHLPLFLGTLFSLQRDPTRGDLRHTADQVLGEFLEDLTSSATALTPDNDDDSKAPTPASAVAASTKLRAIVAKSVSIVVFNCSSTESLSRVTAMNWLLAFLNTPGLLLPSLVPSDATIMPDDYDTPRMAMDSNAAANLRALLPLLLQGILGCVDARQAEVSRKAVEAHTILLSAVEAIGSDPSRDRDQPPSYGDDRVISVVCRYLSGPLDQTVTRACCLQWVSLLLELSPQQMLREVEAKRAQDEDSNPSEQPRPSLLDSVFATLQHPSSEVCIAALQVLSRISSFPKDDEYFPLVCTRLLELLKTNRKSVALADEVDEDATHLHNPPQTAGSEDGGDAHQHNHQQQQQQLQGLQSLALRYRLIIRHLCCHIDVERFYRHIALNLQRDEDDAEFKSIAVYLFNWILLTAPETNTLRDVLHADANTREALSFTWQQLTDLAASSDTTDWNKKKLPLFVRILVPWMSNPASALSLCLWVGRYDLACKFVGIIAEDQGSIGSVPWSVRKGIDRTVSQSTPPADSTDGAEPLLQLDQLVHLLESPVFTRLRLELLPNSYLIEAPDRKKRQQSLLDCLVGLVMLVPQNTRAFKLLKERLDVVYKAFAMCQA
ncbi:PtdIns(3,5)P(2) sythesis regulation factor [Perkinsus olseni]|uniref:PtdIns(3,5)P(2) sythesis regulation factor n=1 Tax=Perkinsus olseni TaxID=32597 RepID=A0A7J6NSN3_PEROL|nr:PtdIns(3,5)P(2) sythesis regulation factor [Perkinsus olseni]